MTKEQKQVIRDLKKDLSKLLDDYIPDIIATQGLPAIKAFKPITAKISAENKSTIISLAKKGQTIENVTEQFPMYTKMQISAIFAHVTMGTYN